MKETLEQLEKEHGLAKLLWAIHDLVEEKQPGARWNSVELKLAECAEFAQEVENE
jgi:hypothetical protein